MGDKVIQIPAELGNCNCQCYPERFWHKTIVTGKDKTAVVYLNTYSEDGWHQNTLVKCLPQNAAAEE